MRGRKYDLFLSYSPFYAKTVQLLASELNDAGINVWFDQWKLVPGQDWVSILEQAMTQSAAVAICIGPKGNEEWPQKDLSLALSIQQQDPSFKIIPLLLPESNLADIPEIISRMQFINFTYGIKNPKAIESLVSAIRENPLTLSRSSFQRQFSLISSSSFIPRPSESSFVARRDREGNDIINRLKEDLAPRKNRLVVLWGAGGVGKTTLAAKAAHELSEAFNQRVVWINSEERGEFNLSIFFDGIAAQLGHPDIRPLPPEAKKEQVRDLVMSAPTLIVLDGFDTISPEDQNSYLQWLEQPSLCSALITTRQRIESARNILIDSMSREEANDFLQRLIAQVHEPKVFVDIDYSRLIQTTQGNPLMLQWVVAQIELAQNPQEVLDDLRQGEGDAVQRVFNRSFNLPLLSNGGRAVLLALSLFVPSATRPALAQVAGLSRSKDKKRFKEAVKSLADLLLIRTTEGGQRLTVEGLTRELAKQRLSIDPRAKAFSQRFITRFLRYAQAHTQTTPEDLDALEIEKDNVLAAMDIAFETKDWKSLIQIIDETALMILLDIRGYWDEAIRRWEQGVIAARAENNYLLVAKFTVSLGSLRARRGEMDEARRAYEQALTYYRDSGSEMGIARTLHQLGMIAQNEGDLTQAQQFYVESLEIAKNLGNRSGIASTSHQLATIARLQNDLSKARLLYNETLKIEKELSDTRGIALTTWGLGNVAWDEHAFEEAREYFTSSLEIFKQLGDQGNLAGVLHQLGLMAEEAGDRAEATRLLHEALIVYEKLGSPLAQIARQNLDQLKSESL